MVKTHFLKCTLNYDYWIILNVKSFFASIVWLSLGNGSVVFGQNCQCRVFAWLICFEVPWDQKSVLNKLFFVYLCLHVCTRVCACASLFGKYSAIYIFKTNKDRNTNFYTQIQISVRKIVSGFGDNLKKKEIIREEDRKRIHKKTTLTIFFERDLKTHLYMNFLECISHLLKKNRWKSKFGIQMLAFGSPCLEKISRTIFFNRRIKIPF